MFVKYCRNLDGTRVFIKLDIKVSAISGNGSYAHDSIPAGEQIMVLSGNYIKTLDIDAVSKSLGLSIEDPLQIGEDEFLILDYKSKAINHSCNPNAGIRKKSELFALRDISVGEEITYDYSTTAYSWDGNTLAMPCQCGAINCRKKITDALSLPPETLAHYLRLGALPDYLLKLITTAEIGT